MFRDSRISFPLRYTETMVSRPSKTRAVREEGGEVEEEEEEGVGKVVLYVQFASLTLFVSVFNWNVRMVKWRDVGLGV
jgi:hypothetical protein